MECGKALKIDKTWWDEFNHLADSSIVAQGIECFSSNLVKFDQFLCLQLCLGSAPVSVFSSSFGFKAILFLQSCILAVYESFLLLLHHLQMYYWYMYLKTYATFTVCIITQVHFSNEYFLYSCMHLSCKISSYCGV